MKKQQSKSVQMKTGTVIRVNWVDAATGGKPWVSADEMPDGPPEHANVENVGFLVKKVKGGVWLAMGKNKEPDYCNVMFIPNGMITKLEEVKS